MYVIGLLADIWTNPTVWRLGSMASFSLQWLTTQEWWILLQWDGAANIVIKSDSLYHLVMLSAKWKVISSVYDVNIP